jgi:antitoxin HicB
MSRRYVVILQPEEIGGFSVSVPDLPGCVSQGETEGEALANVREAIHGYFEGLKADGLPVPESRARIATVQSKGA